MYRIMYQEDEMMFAPEEEDDKEEENVFSELDGEVVEDDLFDDSDDLGTGFIEEEPGTGGDETDQNY